MGDQATNMHRLSTNRNIEHIKITLNRQDTDLHQVLSRIFQQRGLVFHHKAAPFTSRKMVFRENSRLHSGGDVSSTSRNLKITPKPKILLKAKVFASLLCFAPLFSVLHTLSAKLPLFFSFQALKMVFCPRRRT